MFGSACEVSDKASHHTGGLLRFFLNSLEVMEHYAECGRFPVSEKRTDSFPKVSKSEALLRVH